MIATTILDYTEKIYYDTDEAGRWRRDVNEGNRIQNELISDAKSIALSAALLLIGGAICDGAAALGYAVKVEKNKKCHTIYCSSSCGYWKCIGYCKNNRRIL